MLLFDRIQSILSKTGTTFFFSRVKSNKHTTKKASTKTSALCYFGHFGSHFLVLRHYCSVASHETFFFFNGESERHHCHRHPFSCGKTHHAEFPTSFASSDRCQRLARSIAARYKLPSRANGELPTSQASNPCLLLARYVPRYRSSVHSTSSGHTHLFTY